jgi:hypothetical protein
LIDSLPLAGCVQLFRLESVTIDTTDRHQVAIVCILIEHNAMTPGSEIRNLGPECCAVSDN